MKKIVFISQLDKETQSTWLSCFKSTLVNEIILLPEEVSEDEIKDIDIAIVANPDPAILAKFTHLIWLQSLWAGVEKLLNDKFTKSVKIVRLIDPQLAKTMAEAVIAWTLYLHRNMPEYAQQQIKKQWRQLPYKPAKALNVGVLGAGNLGAASIKSLQQLGYQVSCWSKTPKQFAHIKSHTGSAGLRAMMSNSDILISLLPLTPQTHHILNESLLSLLPVGAKIINFSRGSVIDTNALVKLLATRHIAHAVLDVFEHEPLTSANPLWENPNITVLPHISAQTDRHSAVKIASENIKQYRESLILPVTVNTKNGY